MKNDEKTRENLKKENIEKFKKEKEVKKMRRKGLQLKVNGNIRMGTTN